MKSGYIHRLFTNRMIERGRANSTREFRARGSATQCYLANPRLFSRQQTHNHLLHDEIFREFGMATFRHTLISRMFNGHISRHVNFTNLEWPYFGTL